MERSLTYKITEKDAGLTISEYLQQKSYSSQTIKELKKMRESILVDGR